MNPAGSAYLLLLVTISTNSSPAPALGKLQTSGKTNIFNRNFVTNDPIISVFNSQDVRRGGDGDESRSQPQPSHRGDVYISGNNGGVYPPLKLRTSD